MTHWYPVNTQNKIWTLPLALPSLAYHSPHWFPFPPLAQAGGYTGFNSIYHILTCCLSFPVLSISDPQGQPFHFWCVSLSVMFYGGIFCPIYLNLLFHSLSIRKPVFWIALIYFFIFCSFCSYWHLFYVLRFYEAEIISFLLDAAPWGLFTVPGIYKCQINRWLNNVPSFLFDFHPVSYHVV